MWAGPSAISSDQALSQILWEHMPGHKLGLGLGGGRTSAPLCYVWCRNVHCGGPVPSILWVLERSAPRVPGLERNTRASTPGSKAPGGPLQSGLGGRLSSSTNQHSCVAPRAG